VSRFVGYSDRPPFLRYVDVETGLIQPAAELLEIPQGIDEVVPLDAVVAVRCGPHWFALGADLSGSPRPLSTAEETTAFERSRDVEVSAQYDGPIAQLLSHGDVIAEIQHPEIAYWHGLASLDPQRRRVAIAGSTVPRRPKRPMAETLRGPYEKESASVLALVDLDTGDVRLCTGHFDQFCYPPAWSASADLIAFGAPFERRRLFVVEVSERCLRTIRFDEEPPMPLLDAQLLPRP
jgi:hypothetical protein